MARCAANPGRRLQRGGNPGIEPSFDVAMTTSLSKQMHAALRINIPNYASAIVTADEVAVHVLCDDTGDIATASLLENWIDQAQRRIWFPFETSRS